MRELQKDAKYNARMLLDHVEAVGDDVDGVDYDSAMATLDAAMEYASRLMKNLEELS